MRASQQERWQVNIRETAKRRRRYEALQEQLLKDEQDKREKELEQRRQARLFADENMRKVSAAPSPPRRTPLSARQRTPPAAAAGAGQKRQSEGGEDPNKPRSAEEHAARRAAMREHIACRRALLGRAKVQVEARQAGAIPFSWHHAKQDAEQGLQSLLEQQAGQKTQQRQRTPIPSAYVMQRDGPAGAVEHQAVDREGHSTQPAELPQSEVKAAPFVEGVYESQLRRGVTKAARYRPLPADLPADSLEASRQLSPPSTPLLPEPAQHASIYAELSSPAATLPLPDTAAPSGRDDFGKQAGKLAGQEHANLLSARITSGTQCSTSQACYDKPENSFSRHSGRASQPPMQQPAPYSSAANSASSSAACEAPEADPSHNTASSLGDSAYSFDFGVRASHNASLARSQIRVPVASKLSTDSNPQQGAKGMAGAPTMVSVTLEQWRAQRQPQKLPDKHHSSEHEQPNQSAHPQFMDEAHLQYEAPPAQHDHSSSAAPPASIARPSSPQLMQASHDVIVNAMTASSSPALGFDELLQQMQSLSAMRQALRSHLADAQPGSAGAASTSNALSSTAAPPPATASDVPAQPQPCEQPLAQQLAVNSSAGMRLHHDEPQSPAGLKCGPPAAGTRKVGDAELPPPTKPSSSGGADSPAQLSQVAFWCDLAPLHAVRPQSTDSNRPTDQQPIPIAEEQAAWDTHPVMEMATNCLALPQQSCLQQNSPLDRCSQYIAHQPAAAFEAQHAQQALYQASPYKADAGPSHAIAILAPVSAFGHATDTCAAQSPAAPLQQQGSELPQAGCIHQDQIAHGSSAVHDAAPSPPPLLQWNVGTRVQQASGSQAWERPRVAQHATQPPIMSEGANVGFNIVSGAPSGKAARKPVAKSPRSGKPLVKDAEAPLVRKGSYARAAQQARERLVREQQKRLQLAAENDAIRQAAAAKAAAAKMQAQREQATKVAQASSIMGSYTRSAPAEKSTGSSCSGSDARQPTPPKSRIPLPPARRAASPLPSNRNAAVPHEPRPAEAAGKPASGQADHVDFGYGLVERAASPPVPAPDARKRARGGSARTTGAENADSNLAKRQLSMRPPKPSVAPSTATRPTARQPPAAVHTPTRNGAADNRQQQEDQQQAGQARLAARAPLPSANLSAPAPAHYVARMVDVNGHPTSISMEEDKLLASLQRLHPKVLSKAQHMGAKGKIGAGMPRSNGLTTSQQEAQLQASLDKLDRTLSQLAAARQGLRAGQVESCSAPVTRQPSQRNIMPLIRASSAAPAVKKPSGPTTPTRQPVLPAAQHAQRPPVAKAAIRALSRQPRKPQPKVPLLHMQKAVESMAVNQAAEKHTPPILKPYTAVDLNQWGVIGTQNYLAAGQGPPQMPTGASQGWQPHQSATGPSGRSVAEHGREHGMVGAAFMPGRHHSGASHAAVQHPPQHPTGWHYQHPQHAQQGHIPYQHAGAMQLPIYHPQPQPDFYPPQHAWYPHSAAYVPHREPSHHMPHQHASYHHQAQHHQLIWGAAAAPNQGAQMHPAGFRGFSGMDPHGHLQQHVAFPSNFHSHQGRMMACPAPKMMSEMPAGGTVMRTRSRGSSASGLSSARGLVPSSSAGRGPQGIAQVLTVPEGGEGPVVVNRVDVAAKGGEGVIKTFNAASLLA